MKRVMNCHAVHHHMVLVALAATDIKAAVIIIRLNHAWQNGKRSQQIRLGDGGGRAYLLIIQILLAEIHFAREAITFRRYDDFGIASALAAKLCEAVAFGRCRPVRNPGTFQSRDMTPANKILLRANSTAKIAHTRL